MTESDNRADDAVTEELPTDAASEAPTTEMPAAQMQEDGASGDRAAGEADTGSSDAGAADSGAEGGRESEDSEEETPDVKDPARVLRIGSMLGKLLDDLRGSDELDAAGRKRLSRIHAGVRDDLGEVLSDELLEEYDRGSDPLPTTPSRGELLVAVSHAVGWIEGLVQGIQTAIMARQAMNGGEGNPAAQIIQAAKAGGESPSGPGNYL